MVKRRKLSETGIYHVYLRGASRRYIFYDDADRFLFCNTLNRFATKYNVKIYAYVLMDNHVHMLLHTDNLSLFMGAMMISFVRAFNKSHFFTNNLCGGRFGSSVKDTMDKIRDCILYILANPIKSEMCKDIKEFRWSSFSGKQKEVNVDNMFIQLLFESKEKLREEVNSSICPSDLSLYEKDDIHHKTTFFELSEMLTRILKGRKLALLDKNELFEIKNYLLTNSSSSYANIARLLNVNYKFVRERSPR